MISYESTSDVSSSKVDGLIYERGMEFFKEICQEENPNFELSPQIYYNMLDSLLKEKKQFSVPGVRIGRSLVQEWTSWSSKSRTTTS